MPTNNYPGIGYINKGFDFNFFQKVTVTASTFGGGSVDGYQPDIIIWFPMQTLLLLNEDASSIVQVSFNGNTVHDELNPTLPSRGIAYDNRVVSLIWFRLSSGASAVVSIRAYGTR
jgi:hypothetical protein